MRALLAIAIAVVDAGTSALAQAPSPPAPRELPAAAIDAVQAFQRRTAAPGLSIALGRGDAVRFAQGFGFADLENEVPATAATVYRLASISKPITAVLALQLVERGALRLDEDVRTWVPEFPAKPWPITLRQLLCHQGGIRHYRAGEAESTAHFASQREAVARFCDDALLQEPGTKYHYSTYGYCLAGACVEAAGKQVLPAAVAALAQRIGAPTLQDDDVRRLIPHRAQGYVRSGDTFANSALMDGSYKLGGGGLCSSAPDLARFCLALLGGHLLTPESLAAMTTEQRVRDGGATGYGLGLRIGNRDGHRELVHGGAQSRVSTVIVLWPESRACAVVLCNLEGVQCLPLAQQLLDLLAAGSDR